MANALDLDALEATAKAATPGPWEQGNAEDVSEMMVLGIAECHSYHRRPGPCPPPTPGDGAYCEGCADYAEDDARFIATFDPPTVLALIERLRAAEQRADNAEGQVAAVRRYLDILYPHRHGDAPCTGQCVGLVLGEVRAALATRAEATPERGQTYSNALEKTVLTPEAVERSRQLFDPPQDAPS